MVLLTSQTITHDSYQRLIAMTNMLLDRVRQDLKANVDAKTQATSQHFFKEAITAYGVSVPRVNAIYKLTRTE